MARKEVVSYNITSDLSGTPLTEENVCRVKLHFIVDGESNRAELDLSAEETDALMALLKPYGDAVGGFSTAKVEIGRTASATDKARNEAIRKWAKEMGPEYIWHGKKLDEVSDRGRLSKHVQDAYAAIVEGDGSAPDTDDAPADQTANGNGEATPVTAPEFQPAKSKGRK